MNEFWNRIAGIISRNAATDYINSYNYGNQMQVPFDWMHLPYDELVEIKRLQKQIESLQFVNSISEPNPSPVIQIARKMQADSIKRCQDRERELQGIMDMKMRKKFLSLRSNTIMASPYGMTTDYTRGFFNAFPDYNDAFLGWKRQMLNSMESHLNMLELTKNKHGNPVMK